MVLLCIESMDIVRHARRIEESTEKHSFEIGGTVCGKYGFNGRREY